MECSSLCQEDFIPIYEKLDDFGQTVVQLLNQSNLSKELKKRIDEISIDLIVKTKLSIEKISHHHARLDATSQVLEQLLSVNYEMEMIHLYKGMNWIDFLGLCFIFLCIGINIEIIRNLFANK